MDFLIKRAAPALAPYEMLTSTPADGTTSMMSWVTLASALASTARPPATAGRVASRRSGLAALTRLSCTVVARPRRLAGQSGSGPGVPRYTARTSSRGHARGWVARFTTGHDAGTRTLTPSKVTVRLAAGAARLAAAAWLAAAWLVLAASAAGAAIAKQPTTRLIATNGSDLITKSDRMR
jgi:hypothetical protein